MPGNDISPLEAVKIIGGVILFGCCIKVGSCELTCLRMLWNIGRKEAVICFRQQDSGLSAIAVECDLCEGAQAMYLGSCWENRVAAAILDISPIL